MKKKSLLISLIVILALVFAGCNNQLSSSNSNEFDENSTKPVIVTSFYPVEEITKAIVLDTAQVKVLVPAGTEPHSFEPTLSQIVTLSKADVFISMGGLFEHIEESIIEANPTIEVIYSTNNLNLVRGESHSHEHEGEYEENESAEEHDVEERELIENENITDENVDFDPHVWLSIHNMEAMVLEIEEHLIELYPENEEFYHNNTDLYLQKLEELEEEYVLRLSSCKKDKIIVNHKAFGYLADEYGFEQISVSGFSPESEPTPNTIKRVIDEARENDLKFVFSEGQLDPKTALTIARDIDGEVLELNPIKQNEDEDYFSIMSANLDNLVKGLECED